MTVTSRVVRPNPLATSLAALALAGCGLFGPTSMSDSLAAATREVDRWVAAHPDAWTLDLASTRPLQRASWSVPCDQNPASGFLVLEHTEHATRMLLHFRCPLGPSGTGEDLGAAFSHAVLDALPHGIHTRAWVYTVSTPSSALWDGVTFASAPDSRLVVTIDTPLYAIMGRNITPACEAPVDGPALAGCFLLREHRIPLHLRLVVPFDPAVLR